MFQLGRADKKILPALDRLNTLLETGEVPGISINFTEVVRVEGLVDLGTGDAGQISQLVHLTQLFSDLVEDLCGAILS